MSAAFVMILRGLADGTPTDWDGQFLMDFDFEAGDGRGAVSLTPDLTSAKRFNSMEAALTYRGTVPKCAPRRPDGQPNRPLIATNWEIYNAGPLP